MKSIFTCFLAILMLIGMGKLKSQTITTIAGNGVGDGNDASESYIQPNELYPDEQGNLYVGEFTRIRKIDAETNIVTTIVGTGLPGNSGDGGQATNARIGLVGGIHLYNGTLIFSDLTNHVIRTVDLSSGIISTIAGTGTPGYSGDNGPALQSQFNSPQGIDVDEDGNIYIAELQGC